MAFTTIAGINPFVPSPFEAERVGGVMRSVEQTMATSNANVLLPAVAVACFRAGVDYGRKTKPQQMEMGQPVSGFITSFINPQPIGIIQGSIAAMARDMRDNLTRQQETAWQNLSMRIAEEGGQQKQEAPKPQQSHELAPPPRQIDISQE